MSPLIRSLVALSALLAAVNADCVEIEVGHETNNPVILPPIHINPPGEDVPLPNNCAPGPVIGEKALVCSYRDGDTCKPNPHIVSGTYTPLSVDCPCDGGCKAFVTQFC